MSGTSRSFFKAGALALNLAVIGLISLAANAASINYGNFGPVPPGISFLGVTETSVTDAVPLYGPPAPYSVGLDFNPAGFVAAASNGSADLTDGQLNFTVDSLANIGINFVSVSEAGDYSLAGGPGTAATQVLAGAILRVTIKEINGVNIAPVNLTPVNASFGDSLPGNVIVAPWSLGLFLDIGAQMAGLGFGPADNATRVDVVIDNQMLAISESGTVAFIAKKDFIVDVGTDIPEPSTVALAGLALCGLGFASRKR